MNKNNLAIAIIVLCTLCLILGIFNSGQNVPIENYTITKKQMGTMFIANSNKIALITIDGIIDSSNKVNAFANDFSAQNALKSLRAAEKDPDIKGVILKINSPGGTVAMSQSIYKELLRIRKVKPVVVSMEDLAASGGYYIASAADRIFAMEGTLTGSIGVIFSTMDIHQLLSEKLLISPNVIKSGKYKDIGSGYRPMTNEDRALLTSIVDDSYAQFLNAIKVGRIERNDDYTVQKTELKYNILKSHADGRIFTGLQAQKLGFIDSTGDLTDAQNAIKTMANEKFKTKADAVLIPYSKAVTFSDYLFGVSENLFNNNTSIFDSLIPTSVKLCRKPLYLWE